MIIKFYHYFFHLLLDNTKTQIIPFRDGTFRDGTQQLIMTPNIYSPNNHYFIPVMCLMLL